MLSKNKKEGEKIILKLDNEEIIEVQQAKYLGFMLDTIKDYFLLNKKRF